jgi:hypothetical protein
MESRSWWGYDGNVELKVVPDSFIKVVGAKPVSHRLVVASSGSGRIRKLSRT